MKYLFAFLAILGALTTAHSQQKASAADEQAVRAATNSFITSWNKHDFSDMANYTTADVDWVTPRGIWWKGRDVAQKAMQARHQVMLKNTTVKLNQLTVKFLTPNVATVHQLLHINGVIYPPDGVNRGNNKSGNNDMMSTLTLVKQQGKWLIAARQATDVTPETPAKTVAKMATK